ncbi:MAG TPA: PTS fructose transporter subunit IIA, partial [Catenibacterium sp.]|nr:PTS fructose transporter subunit IIA [Catenibacterium sp.]
MLECNHRRRRKMKYVVLVSHGEFAKGLANALSMLAGEKKEVIAVGLENGKTADEFAEVFKEAVSPITGEDEIILLGDLIGGSPLTTALNVINEKGLTDNTVVLGG